MPFRTAFRIGAAIVAATAVVLVLLIGVELFSTIVHPTPTGFQGTQEEICAHVANYPHGVLAVVVVLWGITALLGTWIAGRIGNLGSAVVMAILLSAAVLFNVAMLPYPVWFKIVQPIVILLAVVVGCRWSQRTPVAVA